MVTEKSVNGFLPVPDLMIGIDAVGGGVGGDEPPVPGKRRVYKKSKLSEQPPSSGYFPIINCD